MNKIIKNTGTLYIVATPIGNLDDITHRAIQVLKDVDIIACEDTRHSGRLLANYGIKNRLISFHQHNENNSAQEIVRLLQSGENIGLISDAGTPLISDPGYPLVKLAHTHGIKVVPIVGASAIIGLLSSSGLPTNEFHFCGFLSAKQQQRQEQLKHISTQTFTNVIYESSHRIVKCLEDMQVIFPDDRVIAMGREMTKTFETIKQAPISEMLRFVRDDKNQQKGEFVIAISATEQKQISGLSDEQKQLARILTQSLPPKKAAKIVAEYCDGKSKDVYNYIVSL